MSNNQPEEIVRKDCLDRLEQWRIWGIVVDFDNVHDLGKKCFGGRWIMNTEKGKRDIIAWFKVDTLLWTYLIECKAPDGGFWNEHQQTYAKKFEGLDNCIYEVVSDCKQIDITLDRISRRTQKQLQQAGEFLFPTTPAVVLEEEF